MSTEFFNGSPTFLSRLMKMAATCKCPILIENLRKKLIGVDVPWCDEFEKMICGMNFKAANSPNMQAHKLGIRKRLKDFNDDSIPDGSTLESLKLRRLSVARQFLGNLGRSTNIEAPLFVTFGCNVFIGEGCYINRNVSIFDSAPVTIGDRVLIGPGTCICTDTHEVESSDRRESNNGSYAKQITIGDDVWICMNVTILPGVTIGRGCTIGAGAVVAKNVEENTLVAGVPARLIRTLRPPEPNVEKASDSG